MARKSTAIIGTQLRIRESLRRRLEQQARQHGLSLNAEMTSRLERSFDTENVRALDALRADMEELANRIRQATEILSLITLNIINPTDNAAELNIASAIELIRAQRAAFMRVTAAPSPEKVEDGE